MMRPKATFKASRIAGALARSRPRASPQPLVKSLLYGARTIIALNPTPAPTDLLQEVLLIAVRGLGPLLLGLAKLAIRGRGKLLTPPALR